jgi:putative endonuclease
MGIGKWLRRRKMGDPKQLGRMGEWLAYDHLVRHGYDVIARGWRAPFGEVDLVARKEGRLHFIEVKTRMRDPLHSPEEAVTAERQARYFRLARYFQKEHHLEDLGTDFHVISIQFDRDGGYDLTLREHALR